MRIPSNEITNANKAIVNALSNSTLLDRGSVAQASLANMRNLTEHILVFAVFGDSVPSSSYYDAIKEAADRAKRDQNLRFIYDFRFNLQKVVSHYTPSESSSERLLLMYMENLFLLRKFACEQLGISILQNLEMFPLKQSSTFESYYSYIADKIDELSLGEQAALTKERFYINSVKPVILGKRILYELSLSIALDSHSKTDRVIAFSCVRIPTHNSVRLNIMSSSISIRGRAVPVELILGWECSIRPCEINNLLKVVGCEPNARGNLSNYQSLMRILQETGMNLYELCSLPETLFVQYRNRIMMSGSNTSIEQLLDRCHDVLRDDGDGANVLRYLLYRPRNNIIKEQLQNRANNLLGFLFLRNECIPFDTNPFSSNLFKSKTAGLGNIRCISAEGREADLLASRVISMCENDRRLYLSEKYFEQYTNLDSLIAQYNQSLYKTHKRREIAHETGHVFIRGYEEDFSVILDALLELTEQGVAGYSASSKAWLAANPGVVDDPIKEAALTSMFTETRVAFVYGSAGTGKTTLINHVCSSMPGIRITAIANTNPAVESLRRRVKSVGCKFQTVTKHLADPSTCDLLIIDECSTVSNGHMRKILEHKGFSILLLVGDVRQIESIDFGNWFDLSQTFMPAKCLHELQTPWRTTSDALVALWDSVRTVRCDIAEIIEANGFSHDIDDSLFQPECDDEIVLCLNYDGLYGINNVNLIMQSQNPNPVFKWGIHHYKVGDPVLFNDSNRFSPLLYNNLKGRIVDIKKSSENMILFEVAVKEPINELSVGNYQGLSFAGTVRGMAVVRFAVNSIKNPDEEGTAENIVPFQVAYAVSIHKAQGLEYDSVKVIVTENVENRVTHDIFYTAITRARESLKIYWAPETQANIIKSLEVPNRNEDACLVANRLGFKMHP